MPAGRFSIARRKRRHAHGGDIAFLFRAMTDVSIYERALADEGFEYHTLGGTAFYAQQEIRDVVNLLSSVQDPFDEVALAGALRSPIFSLSDNGLLWLARFEPGGLVAGLEHCHELPQLSADDRRQAARASRLLSRWRDCKDRTGLAAILSQILDESGFDAALVCESLGTRKLANSRKLLLMAREYDRQGGFTLADLVARLRTYLDDPPREELAAATEEESTNIRLMSIHRAKGLEFPIVVIPDLNRQTDCALSRWVLTTTSVWSFVPRPARRRGPLTRLKASRRIALAGRPSGPSRMMRTAGKRSGSSTWRPRGRRDFLVISAGLPANPRPESPAMQLLWERFDWQTGGLLTDLPENWPVPQIEVVAETPPEPARKPGRPSLAQRLASIERAIVDAELGEPEPVSRPSPRPLLINLQPGSSLSSPGRLDRLIRTMLVDKGLLRGESLHEACLRVGERQAPAAGSALVAEAVRWLEPWLTTPVFRELRDASRARRPIERNVEWSLAWPLEGDASTVFRGCTEAVYRDRQGRWRPVIVSTLAGESESEYERLR